MLSSPCFLWWCLPSPAPKQMMLIKKTLTCKLGTDHVTVWAAGICQEAMSFASQARAPVGAALTWALEVYRQSQPRIFCHARYPHTSTQGC